MIKSICDPDPEIDPSIDPKLFSDQKVDIVEWWKSF